MKKVTLSHLSNYITEHLDISDRMLCNLIGITPAALSSQKESALEGIMKNKVGRRVSQMFVVIHHFAIQGISKEIILECIHLPVLKDFKDNMDSISTSIQQDKYEAEVLLEMGKLAYQEYQRRLQAKDDLYPAVKELLAEAI